MDNWRLGGPFQVFHGPVVNAISPKHIIEVLRTVKGEYPLPVFQLRESVYPVCKG